MSTDTVAEAAAVLRRFIEANDRQDGDAMKACLNRSTLEGGGFSGPMPAEIKLRMGEPEPAGDRVIIPVGMHTADSGPDAPPVDEIRCVMVVEDGAWKFDLQTSTQAEMDELDAAFEGMAEGIGQAMSGAMEAIGNAIVGGLDGSSDEELPEPSDWLDAEEFPREEEWSVLPTLVGMNKLTFFVSDKGGKSHSAVRTEAAFDAGAFIEQLGEGTPATLLATLEKELGQGLGRAMDRAREQLPRAVARLRAVRIEPPRDYLARCLVLDGPDLVYQIELREPAGRYTPEELLRIVPGVLAGLPEDADRYPAGKSMLPTPESPLDERAYRDVVAPRLMRRLCRMVGQPIGLDVDWSMLVCDENAARAMCLWGLNRVVGAVGLVFPEGSEERPSEGWLRAVRMTTSYGTGSATFERGVLSVEITPGYGEKGCLYEHQIAAVLRGEAASS